MNEITSINGILLAPLNKLNEHVENETAHVTEEERTMWNAKADASSFNAHKEDAAAHITAKEREIWKDKQDKLTDGAGNMMLEGDLSVTSTINANGGVNIPLASSPDTPTSGVNRLCSL